MRLSIQHRIKAFTEHNLHLAGISRGRPVIGPWAVQIDPTNKCNRQCLGCWLHSPLAATAGIKPNAAELSLAELQRLVGELEAIGTRMLYLSGGGEPFCHPKIFDFLEAIQTSRLQYSIHTNFLWALKESPEMVVGLNSSQITVSLWGVSETVCAELHPHANTQDIKAILDLLKAVLRLPGRPQVRLRIIVTAINVHELPALIALGQRLGVDAVDLAFFDAIPGVTDQLMLTQDQARDLLALLETLPKNARTSFNPLFVNQCLGIASAGSQIDSPALLNLLFPCYAGWFTSRITADGSVLYCLKAHRTPMGTIRDDSFSDIWVNDRYARMRRAGQQYHADPEAFALIGNNPNLNPGCLAGCDDYDTNVMLRRQVARYRSFKQFFLRDAWIQRFRKIL